MTLDQKAPHARGHMVVDRAISRRTGPVVEVSRPADQHAVNIRCSGVYCGAWVAGLLSGISKRCRMSSGLPSPMDSRARARRRCARLWGGAARQDWIVENRISKAEMATINIERHAFHGEWNYTIRPNQQPPFSGDGLTQRPILSFSRIYGNNRGRTFAPAQ